MIYPPVEISGEPIAQIERELVSGTEPKGPVANGSSGALCCSDLQDTLNEYLLTNPSPIGWFFLLNCAKKGEAH